MSPAPSAPGDAKFVHITIVVGVLLAGLNSRPLISSVGSLLPEIQTALGMSAGVAGLLTALPLLSFAVAGPAFMVLHRSLSADKLVIGAILTTVVGLLVRPYSGSVWAFVGTSGLALVAMALMNVAVPGIIRSYVPGRGSGQLTALYGVLTFVGLAAGSSLAVPIAARGGDWKVGLVAWALLPILALVPWLMLARANVFVGASRPVDGGPRVFRSIDVWLFSVFLGLQSAQAFVLVSWLPGILRINGMGAEQAGLFTGLLAVVAIPASLGVAAWVKRSSEWTFLVSLLMACYVAGYLGLLFSPGALTIVWIGLLGSGHGAFSLLLVWVTVHARTTEGADSVSAFVHSIGYSIGAAGPILAGLLVGLTPDPRVIVLLLIVFTLIQSLCGMLISGRASRRQLE